MSRRIQGSFLERTIDNLSKTVKITHIDLGIDEATFAASLRVIDHSWRQGQRCDDEGCFVPFANETYLCFKCESWQSRGDHSVPIPAVTDKLLMRIPMELQKRGYNSCMDFYADGTCSFRIFDEERLGGAQVAGGELYKIPAVAIIRATVVLESKE